MANTWMIYGAYGYSGTLITAEAVRRGLKPIVAGRNREKTAALAAEHGLEFRSADADRIDSIMDDVSLLLNCAGPFEKTWLPTVESCLLRGAHYLDITGEIAVFEAVQRVGSRAEEAGVSLIPGVGFDVVPTDCLAAKLSKALPNATHLELAFHQKGGGISRGTLKTVIAGLGKGSAIRRDGRIEEIPVASLDREVPFSIGTRTAMSIPWGDVSTAYHTTGIPNIVVYQGVHPARLRKLRRWRPLMKPAGLAPFQWLLGKLADRHAGPDEEARSNAGMHLWGAVRAGDRAASMTLDTPEGYELTADSSVSAVERVLGGGISPGALTPARAFGSDFVDGLEGVAVGELTIDDAASS